MRPGFDSPQPDKMKGKKVVEEQKIKRPLIGTGVFLVRGREILMGLRKSSHGSGTWSLFGGHLEFGESLIDCAKREVLEETGVLIKSLRHGPYTEDLYEKEGKHYITFFLLAEMPNDGQEPKITEPDKWERFEWRRWDNLPEPLFLSLKNLKESGYNPFLR